MSELCEENVYMYRTPTPPGNAAERDLVKYGNVDNVEDKVR